MAVTRHIHVVNVLLFALWISLKSLHGGWGVWGLLFALPLPSLVLLSATVAACPPDNNDVALKLAVMIQISNHHTWCSADRRTLTMETLSLPLPHSTDTQRRRRFSTGGHRVVRQPPGQQTKEYEANMNLDCVMFFNSQKENGKRILLQRGLNVISKLCSEEIPPKKMAEGQMCNLRYYSLIMKYLEIVQRKWASGGSV